MTTKDPRSRDACVRQRRCRFGPMCYFVHDQFIGAALERYGEFSPDEADLLVGLLRPGDTAIDAGAYVGCFTLPMAQRVGAKGRVLAFEPHAPAFALLQQNLRLNALQQVEACHAGLGATAGRGRVDAPDLARPGNFGDVRLRLGEGSGDEAELTTVDALSLPRCTLIKADVQGMERELLQGAAQTIARHRPVLYLENDRREHSRALLRQLAELGYRAYWHLPPMARADNFRRATPDGLAARGSINLLCLPDDRAPPVAGLHAVASIDDWWNETMVMRDDDDASVTQHSALFSIARRHFGRARFEAACTVLDALLEQQPADADAAYLMAECHRRAGRDLAAIACLQRLLARHGDEREALCALAEAYVDIKRFEAAADAMARAHRCDPSDASLLHGLATMLRRAGRRDEALASLDAALELAPLFDDARFERALVLLEQGRLPEAWRDYDLRHGLDPGYAAPAGLARWQGEPFAGKRLRIVCEGGHGDTVWAARFLPAVRALGGEVFVEVRPEQRELLAALDGVDGFIEPEAGSDGFDLYCPILSLPGCLGVASGADHPPARLQSRCVPPDRWAPLLARADGRLKVGIVWCGSEGYANNRNRAAAVEDFLPLLELPSVQLYSLQKGPQQAELREAGLGELIIDCDDCDFAETAALVEALDLIVMTDSAVAHIAGSLGKPVWVLLDSAPFWYFGGAGERCPWYPSMRLFRQRAAGDWADVVARVASALAERGSDRAMA